MTLKKVEVPALHAINKNQETHYTVEDNTMSPESFKQAIKKITIGKRLPDAIYLHQEALTLLSIDLQQLVSATIEEANLTDTHWNIVKLFKNKFSLSLLYYPNFYENSYPELRHSININLATLSCKTTYYKNPENPPILHRKETMIAPESHYFSHFRAITQEGEALGLYENSRMIGFKANWLQLIHDKGFKLMDGRLIKLKHRFDSEHTTGIDRHKTAISRRELSAPMKQLARLGYLDGNYTLFDYGCGRGDDLRELEAHGLSAQGWDPNFKPDEQKINADIVNLGFVINVIEDKAERLETLRSAWGLANKFLVVSVMLANESYISKFKPYKDGVVTSRNTFQKYYTQAEIKAYIERSLQEDAIAAAPGIFYIFKDNLEEQKYLKDRYKRNHSWHQLTSSDKSDPSEKDKLTVTQNNQLFNDFWLQCLKLGRLPANDEFEKSERVRKLVGSHKRALSIMQECFDTNDFEQAQRESKEDLLLYFAMSFFKKKKPYKQQPESIKRDVKAFFKDHKTALKLATELLFSIANTKLIQKECLVAKETLPACILNEGHSLIFHRSYLERLPLQLRVYVDTAFQVYGEVSEKIDLIKIHITSSKLTLLSYDNFNQSVPLLSERIKIKMAEQEIDFFDYIDYQMPPLLNKHLLLSQDSTDAVKQKSFDYRLSKVLAINPQQESIISRRAYEQLLSEAGKEIKGFKILTKKASAPNR